MKVLNIMFDGWHPENMNHVQLKDLIDLDAIENSLGNLPYKDYSTEIDPSTERVKSIRMWFRMYGNTYVTKSESNKKPYDSLYQDTPSEELLWNMLSSQGVHTYLYPVTYLASKTTNWLLGSKGSSTRDNSKLISGVFKNYRTTNSHVLTEGKFKTVKTDYIKSALMPVVLKDMDVSQWATDNDLELLSTMKTSADNEEFLENFKRFQSEVSPNMMNRIIHLLEGNAEEWYDRVLPGVSSMIDRTPEESHSFVHLSLEESACIHYFYNTPEVLSYASRDFTKRIIEAIELYNPDVLILNGDHSMVPIDDEESPYHGHFQVDKSTRPAIITDLGFTDDSGRPVEVPVSTSWAGDYPVYAEHGYRVGARVYYNDVGKKFTDHMDTHEGLNTGLKIDPNDDTTLEYLYQSLVEVLK